MRKEIRILIVDDHPVVREGLHGFLETEPGLTVVGEAADGVEVVEKAHELHPDVILLDLILPRQSGLEAIHQLRKANPDERILILTSFAEDDKVFPAIKAGALGYLLKDSPPELLVQAIRDVYQGKASLHPTIALKVIQELNQPPDLPPTPDPLTVREGEVLQLVSQGLANREISERLQISQSTVRVHVSNILGKLHLANRTQAALYALNEGITGLD